MHSVAFILPTLLLLVIFPLANANVEKTIFLGPPPPPLSPSLSSSTNPFNPDLSDLGLDRLSPPTPILRTKLNASFPDTNTDADASASPGGKGTESWFLLEGLIPGQRYEVRVCWAATVCFIPGPSGLGVVESTRLTNWVVEATNILRPRDIHPTRNNRRSVPPILDKSFLLCASRVCG